MKTSSDIEFVSEAEKDEIVGAAVLLPVARMIELGSIDPEAITRAQFLDKLKQIGKTHDTAFELYDDRIEEEFRLISHCISVEEHKSAVVLLFTLLEGEINTVIRIHLSIKSFSQNAVTDALRGTDFVTKMDVLLPLLEVKMPARLRNAALQCKTIRNLVVHNKAAPSLVSSAGDKQSDIKIAGERARTFFIENPVLRLQRDIRDFVNDAVYESWAVQWASHLFTKFFVHGET